MRKVTALVMASMLASGSAIAADAISPSTHDAATSNPGQHHMFDGVRLTEKQRQQMRDLMRQARHDLPGVNVAEMEAMHKLVTANKFDEAAVYAQAEKVAQEQVKRQVEMARVRNQMYNLLTPQQKSVLDQKHQQRMQQMEQQLSGLQQASAQK
ncbi:cell-envelope stress modulator CpxP [Serratia rhizosphaerae]|uniref:cell-envelope stress modulator CpxP n=1 Tax=unclassified Serratia (in: enterobacteria) TaxID=2647522 RepID=UPI000CF72513|nr:MULTISPECIES: cell-envelope stress modulator CpxP [unclassified Serratia (in: enterobacteria)]MBU3894925.1 cell-envelope stress modulator CpxP [Serratia rubidaea]AVJ19819.1 stress adaptor protein CpxP [Serratia sp. MYb239]QNK32580.1 Spy/CpxP family protein refolding chaperone [Serratia sp. JUb9]QPT12866.1 cell-envelope stress modulator CpxP [Serratia rubidaea]CAE1151479.1 periplasmic protein combats stress [Serratia sp. Tan611]